MTSNGSTTIVKFIYGDDVDRVKIHFSEPWESTDRTLRSRFDIPADALYKMLDAKDGTLLSFFYLKRLENESIVHIELLRPNPRTNDSSALET